LIDQINDRYIKMSQPDRRNPSPHLDWLNPSSEWAQEDYGALPAAASEPYDWTLKAAESRPTQVIPIVSPVRRGSTKLEWLKRKAGISQSSSAISLEKNATGRIFGRRITSLIKPVRTTPLVESEKPAPAVDKDKTERLVERARTETRRKSPGWALPLLLLAVIALFVFAYIAQK
jgi:hypothetical protein